MIATTCRHIGRIERHLPCPDPRCWTGGVRLIVPRLGGDVEYERAFVIDARFDGGGYWCWSGPSPGIKR